MDKSTLADISVKITNVIKLNLNDTSHEVIKKMLDTIPELVGDINLTIEYLQAIGKEMGIDGDVNTIIDAIQEKAKNAVSDINWNSLWQKVAQGIYYVANLLAGFLPPKWREVILIVLNAYERLVGVK